MNVDEALMAHVEWKVKLRSAIAKQEQLDAATIAKDNCCALGKWFYSDGKAQLGARPEYKRAVEAHKAFHVEAGKVAALINAKKYPEAEKALGHGTAYTDVSGKVGTALTALKKVAKL